MVATKQTQLEVESLTEQELAALVTVRRKLVEARNSKAVGRLTVEFDLQEGGITAKYVTQRYREK